MAIATVEVGWGVFGVASAAIARAFTGSVLMSVTSPIKLITPRLAPRTLRSIPGFGIGFQTVGLAALARSQGVNLVLVAVGAQRLLGCWSRRMPADAGSSLGVPGWGPHTKLGFGSGIIVGLGYLGLSPPFIRADLRSIVRRVRPRA